VPRSDQQEEFVMRALLAVALLKLLTALPKRLEPRAQPGNIFLIDTRNRRLEH
jgi:hypothetical protein